MNLNIPIENTHWLHSGLASPVLKLRNESTYCSGDLNSDDSVASGMAMRLVN